MSTFAQGRLPSRYHAIPELSDRHPYHLTIIPRHHTTHHHLQPGDWVSQRWQGCRLSRVQWHCQGRDRPVRSSWDECPGRGRCPRGDREAIAVITCMKHITLEAIALPLSWEIRRHWVKYHGSMKNRNVGQKIAIIALSPDD
ncbi:MAG: hypothetical protein AB4042_21600 [Leptolyngbyaceae cyanobacterium]